MEATSTGPFISVTRAEAELQITGRKGEILVNQYAMACIGMLEYDIHCKM